MCWLPGGGDRGVKVDPRAGVRALLTEQQETEGRASLVGVGALGETRLTWMCSTLRSLTGTRVKVLSSYL